MRDFEIKCKKCGSKDIKIIGGTKCQEIAVKAASIHKNVN